MKTRRFFVFFALLAVLSAGAQVIPSYNFSDFGLQNLGARSVTITPLQSIGSDGTNFFLGDPLKFTTDAGRLTVSNGLAAGYAYRIEVAGFKNWALTNFFSNSVAGPVNGAAPQFVNVPNPVWRSIYEVTNGVNGKDGTNGVNGSQGIQGIQGIQGPAAANGTNGVNGKDGTNGVNGVVPNLTNYVTNQTVSGFTTFYTAATIGSTNGLGYGVQMTVSPSAAGFFCGIGSSYITLNGATGSGLFSGTATATSFIERVGGATYPRATNLVTKVLDNTAATETVDFNKQELTIVGDITFTGAANWAEDGKTIYLGATVNGVATISWPAVWSPFNTNTVTLTNGLVAFKSFGTNIYIGVYQP